jgi:hypothetical protein
MSKHTVQDENSSSSSSNTLIIDLVEKIDDDVPRKKARYDYFTKSTEKILKVTKIRIYCDKDCRLARKQTNSKYLR